MELYPEQILGSWIKENTKIIYHFYLAGNVILISDDNQIALPYRIETKNRESMLLIDKMKFKVVIINTGAKVPYMSLMTKSGIVTFYKEMSKII